MKGGSKQDRDRELKQYGDVFSKWYHQRKQKMHPGVNATDAELKALHKQWQEHGSPSKFHKGSQF
jgi:hypothetical protein